MTYRCYETKTILELPGKLCVASFLLHPLQRGFIGQLVTVGEGIYTRLQLLP